MITITESADWYRALTLKERISSLNKSPKPEVETTYNLELAQERLRKWRTNSPLKNDAIFAQWLEMQGMTESELLYILGEPIDTLKERYGKTPDWLKIIFNAFTNQSEGKLLLSVKLPPTISDNSVIGFLDIIKPLISEGSEPLNIVISNIASSHTNLPFDPNTIKDVFLIKLLPELLMELVPVMIKKCGEARKKGILKGDTSEQRFDYFLSYMRQKDNALALLQEYPVLARRLVVMINHWALSSVETLERLCKDWENIKNIFTPEQNPGVIVLDNGNGTGDMHRNGQVITLTFSSGFKLLYKPRSLSVDLHFQELLSWLNDNGATLPFRTLKVLNCGNYGWIEFVTPQSCSSEAEIERFYYRQGNYLALLYALCGVDFHSENLIAAGEHPVLIDLETFFSQPIENQTDDYASDHLKYSVLKIGLLPMRIFGNADHKGIDFSGMSSVSGQLTPYPMPYLEAAGTDEIQIKHKQFIFEEENHHQPKLNGENVVLLDYIETVAKGFADLYRLLQKNVRTLIAPDGLITRFANDEVRMILRPTREYGVLLSQGSDPNMLRNAIACEWLFDNLWRKTENLPLLLKTVSSERQSLLDNFIPRFIRKPGSPNLWSDDNTCINDFFPETAMSLVKTRLQQFSEKDLTKQLWFIHASFATLFDDSDKFKPKTYKYNSENNKSLNYDHLIKTASLIGNYLAKLSLSNGNKTTWVGLQVSELDYYYISPLKVDLYNGLSGITLFLAYLGYVTKQPSYTELAQSTLTEIRQLLEKQIEDIKQEKKNTLRSIGGFGGFGGIIHMFLHLSRLWNAPKLMDEALELVDLIPTLIDKDKSFDLIYGSAGCIISLVNLHKYANLQHSKKITDIATQCGNHLIANAQTTSQGKGWITGHGKNPPLGISHGVSGIAWALLELSNLTKEASFASVAKESLDYERSFFSAEMGNWPDVNRENTNDSFRITWCHGAVGIGIARLHSLDYLKDDKLVKQEIDIAVKTVLANGFGNNHSLCHGDLGNLDFLMQASEKLDDINLKTQVENIASVILDSIDKYGWLCGTPLSVESPSLMLGISGIGYQLLRLAEPQIVPSILCLESPKL